MLAPSWEHCRQLHHLTDTWMALLPDIKKIFSSNNGGWSHNRALGMDSLTDLPKNGSNTVIPIGQQKMEATSLPAHLVPWGFGNCHNILQILGPAKLERSWFLFWSFFHIFSNGRIAIIQNMLEMRLYIFTSHNSNIQKLGLSCAAAQAPCWSQTSENGRPSLGRQGLKLLSGQALAMWPGFASHLSLFLPLWG